MLRRSSSRQLQHPALCLILTLLQPVKESANREMRDSEPCVEAVVEALREVGSAGAQVVIMGPQLRRKVAVGPRWLIVRSKRGQFAVFWPFTCQWESTVSTGLSQVGLSVSGSFTLRREAPPSVGADVVNPRRRPAPNLPTVTLQ